MSSHALAADSDRTRDLPAGARERLAAVPMPSRIAALPREARGYPVPRFVEWIDGVPDFRIFSGAHLVRCVKQNRCWICGDPMGRYKSFVIGPMCAINRVSSEPPSHKDCALYAVRVCPFLAIPEMRRQPRGLPGEVMVAGIAIQHNPGVGLVWTTVSYETFKPPGGGVLFDVGDPAQLQWVCRGREATRAEVEDAIDRGFPLLLDEAERESPAAVEALHRMAAVARLLLPAAKP